MASCRIGRPVRLRTCSPGIPVSRVPSSAATAAVSTPRQCDKHAPRAVHAAQSAPIDRFHLLRNYRGVALRVFKHHAREIGYLVAPGASRETLTRLRLDRQASRERTRTEMHERFGAIHQLASQGMNRSAIARYLGLHRHTVQKYLASEQPLERWPFCREVSRLAPYERYLLAQWRAGHRNAMQLWCEIVAQGSGSYHNVSRLTGYLCKCERDDAPAPVMPTAITSAQSAGILLARPEHRPTAEQMGRSGRCAASLPSSLRSSMRGSRSRACCATGPIRILQIGLRSGWRRRRGQVCRN